ncbi:hypothetical protein HZB60_12545 [candidate division KSB1 bacterium]|nr:hypothetical protein [candidate division KSB1 bacterium]
MTLNFSSPSWIHSVVVILAAGAAGCVLGYAIERIVLKRLHTFALRSAWSGDEIMLDGLKGFVTVWGALAGLYLGLLTADFELPAASHLGRALIAVVIVTVTLAAAEAGEDNRALGEHREREHRSPRHG